MFVENRPGRIYFDGKRNEGENGERRDAEGGRGEEINRSFAALPSTARAYVRFLERQAGVPIASISVGPGREQMFDGESAKAALYG